MAAAAASDFGCLLSPALLAPEVSAWEEYAQLLHTAPWLLRGSRWAGGGTRHASASASVHPGSWGSRHEGQNLMKTGERPGADLRLERRELPSDNIFLINVFGSFCAFL